MPAVAREVVIPGHTCVVPGDTWVLIGDIWVVPGDTWVVPGWYLLIPGHIGCDFLTTTWTKERRATLFGLRWVKLEESESCCSAVDPTVQRISVGPSPPPSPSSLLSPPSAAHLIADLTHSGGCASLPQGELQ